LKVGFRQEIIITLVVDVGLIAQEFLDAERKRLGSLYHMHYKCGFYNLATTWYKDKYFKFEDY